MLRLASGLFQTVDITALASEYEVRNSISRLNYSFFHASLALLLTLGWDIDSLSKDHGSVHSAVQATMGKYMGTFLRNLYRSRQLCDYDASMFEREYGADIEKARQEFTLLIKRARTNFHHMYRQARESIK